MASTGAALAATAATAGWMYLDAKYFISYDLGLVIGGIKAAGTIKKMDKDGRYNYFYTLEGHALNPQQGKRTFLIYEGREWTYRQFYDTVLKYGQWLKSTYRIAPDEVVAFDCVNKPNFLFIWFGLWCIGAKVAFINYNLTGQPLLHSIKTSTARLLLVDEEVRDCITDEVLATMSSSTFRKGGGPVEVAFFSDSLEQQLEPTQAIREPDSSRAGQLPTSMAMLIYTSGTTGNPKPAVLAWSRMSGVAAFIPRWLKLTKDDRFYTCMPLYHSAGNSLGCLNSISTGCTFILGHKFSTQTFWKEVRESKATYIQYVGETCRYLLSAPPSPLDRQNNVKVAFGNGLRPDIWNQFKERFGIDTINEFYAATEGAGSTWNRSRNDLTMGAVGRAGKLARWFTGAPQALVEHDMDTEAPRRDAKTGFCKKIDFGRPGAPAGELISKLPDDVAERKATFQGYYNDPKASESKILRDVFVKGDVYYRTGDMVRINEQGFVYFHDRIGDTFRWKSENVSTNEVAEVMCRHASVVEANVYGVSLPNHDGRAGCAALIMKNPDGSERHGATDIDQKTLDELAKHALKTLPRYAVPIFLRLPAAMERTGTNKQQKHHFRADGADPAKISQAGDRMYWLEGGTYRPYEDQHWESINSGKVKL